MIALQVAIIAFVVMELSNIIIMYFKPDFKYGNSMKTFDHWHQCKEDEGMFLFAQYMVRWVANCKLIFLALLVVIVVVGNETLLLAGTIATVLSIGAYFLSLYPVIRKLDKMGKITPAGYSKTLTITIIVFMLMFAAALVVYFVIR